MYFHSVGTELFGTTNRTDDWLAVIARVRQVFAGKLVYGSNWGPETAQIQFWSALDYIGVDAYYPLASAPDPALSTIITNWTPYIELLSNFSSKWGKQIIFCEIGYRSYSNAAMQPWAFTGNGVPDMQAQYNLYKAFFQTAYLEHYFAGVFWWAWETDVFMGSGRCDDE